MNYRQYSNHLKLCQYLGKEPRGEFKNFYDFLTDLWKNMEFTVDEQWGIILHKGTDFYMVQDFKNGYLRCDWDRMWSFFRSTKGMEVSETQDFIQSMVEEHLKCKALTPSHVFNYDLPKVEEHLKCKTLTPGRDQGHSRVGVEEHLKCKTLTPRPASG